MTDSVSRGHGAIVGMWGFTFTAGKTTVDWGFQHWHSDGTELTNSGGQPAALGSFCMGTWAQKGDAQYKLNHWAIAWNPPALQRSDLAGLINIHEEVSVDHGGNAMSGTFSLDLYAADGTTFITHLVDGKVAGKRIVP